MTFKRKLYYYSEVKRILLIIPLLEYGKVPKEISVFQHTTNVLQILLLRTKSEYDI